MSRWFVPGALAASSIITQAGSALAAAPFTDITVTSGVQALRNSGPSTWWLSGITFVDLNHDGHLDLFLADHGGTLGLAAINDGKGNFSKAGGTYPNSEIHLCLDVDEDGKVDMSMTYQDGGAKWWLNKTASGSPMLQLLDVGNVDTRDGNQSRPEALVDLNRDGKLDWVRGAQGQNFHVDFGDGKGNFVADGMLIPQPMGDAQDAGIMYADLNGDGYEDMVINWGGYSSPGGVDYGRARILLNDGKGHLSDQNMAVGVPTDHFAVLGVGDVNQDGYVDLIGLTDRTFPETIYINDGHGHFSVLANAVTGVTGSSEYALWGLATVTDMDNDGVADILIDGRTFFHVLRGTGGGHFSYQNAAWGNITSTAEASVDSGFAFGDIDGDGDLDLMGFTAGDPNRQIALYRNDLPAQNWLNVRPVGLPGNKEGVNSKVRIYQANSNHLLWYEEVTVFSKQAQQNYYAFDQLERHYGLGTTGTVDVTVTFYPSGTVVRKNGAQANTTIVIGEDGTNGTIQPASTPDASTPNVGPPDASVADASVPDVGGPGVGAPDVGTSAASAPDASTPVANVPDGAAPQGDSDGSSNQPSPTGPSGNAGAAGCGCHLEASRGASPGRIVVEILAALLIVSRRRQRGTRNPMGVPRARQPRASRSHNIR